MERKLVTISCRAFVISNNKIAVVITPDMEYPMRVLANHLIDRILEDQKNSSLKFMNGNDILIMEHQNKVLEE